MNDRCLDARVEKNAARRRSGIFVLLEAPSSVIYDLECRIANILVLSSIFARWIILFASASPAKFRKIVFLPIEDSVSDGQTHAPL